MLHQSVPYCYFWQNNINQSTKRHAETDKQLRSLIVSEYENYPTLSQPTNAKPSSFMRRFSTENFGQEMRSPQGVSSRYCLQTTRRRDRSAKLGQWYYATTRKCIIDRHHHHHRTVVLYRASAWVDRMICANVRWMEFAILPPLPH